MNAREIAEQASELFVLSDSFIRIKELIDNESSTIDDIADVIVLDPALAATTLKLANSSFFNYPGKIDSISKSLLVLGITEVYNLVIAYFTRDAFRAISLNKDFLDKFWEQSVDCALVVRYLGRAMQIQHAERLFILGLLHNLGELLVHQLTEAEYSAYAKQVKAQLPWHVQQQVLGYTFGHCSAELLKFWSLPFSLIEPIYYQDEHNFEFLTTESKILYIAKRISLFHHDIRDQNIGHFLSPEQQAELSIDSAMLNDIKGYCDLERLTILALLNPGAAMVY